MARKRLSNAECGEFYAIPLFLSEYKETQRFKKTDIEGPDKQFVFCRIMDNQGVSYIIEIFRIIGDLTVSFDAIIQSGRLYEPLKINGLGIYKKRWRLLGKQEHYDAEKDSQLPRIKFVYPPLPGGTPCLLANGEETEISFEESEQYETSRSWSANHLEKRIIKTLKENGQLI